MTVGTGVLVTVIGEALIDLIPGQAPRSFTACPAGSPFNVAIGLARLGQGTALMARMSDNSFGRMLRERAAAEGSTSARHRAPASPPRWLSSRSTPRRGPAMTST